MAKLQLLETFSLQETEDGYRLLVSAVGGEALYVSITPSQMDDIIESLDLLRPIDEGAAAAYREREDARLTRCRAVVDRLAAEGRLAAQWTPTAAAELLWSMTSMHAWEDLVHRAGWSGREWAQRTTAALEAALVAPQGAGSPVTREMSAPSEPRF